MANGSDIGKIEEYPKKSGITIRSVDNATKGQKYGFSFQVNIPAGVSKIGRIRKQFPTLKDAKEWARKEYKKIREDGTSYSSLPADERQKIGRELRKLKENGVNISEAVDFTLAFNVEERNEILEEVPKLRKEGISIKAAVNFAETRLQPSKEDKLLSDVIGILIQSKAHRNEKGDLAYNSFRDFKCRASRLNQDLGDRIIQHVTGDEIKEWASNIKGSNRTRLNYLRVASEIFRFAKQKYKLKVNPLDDLTNDDRKEIHGRLNEGGKIGVLSVEQADSFINFTADKFPELLGVVTLGLFCGIRTEELKKLTWDKVSIEEGYVTIDGSIAKKRRMRHVTIPDNAIEWLTCCHSRTGNITPYSEKRFEHKFRELRLKAGFSDSNGGSTWPANGMRHSMGTYLYAMTEDPLLTSKELGHKSDDEVLFTHYRALAKKSDGEKYFEIKPAASAAKVVEFL